MRSPFPVVLIAVASSSCVTVGDRPPRSQRVELIAVRRNPDAGLEPSSDDQNLFGANYVFGLEESQLVGELGYRGGRFDRPGHTATTYGEVHVGLRYYVNRSNTAIQPYIGLGLLWNGRGKNEYEVNTHDRYYDDDSDGEFLAWLVANSGPYVTLGADFVLDRFTLGVGVRAVCADDVDISARHPDDVALDVFATLGWTW